MVTVAAACVGSLSTPAVAISSSLSSAVDAYLKPIALAMDARLDACQDGTVGADGECSKTLKILSGGTGSLKQSLSINKASGLPSNMVGKFSESYLRRGWSEDVKESFVRDLSKAAKNGETTFQKAFACNDGGSCKYVVMVLGKGARKGTVDVFAMKSSRQFRLSPNVAVVLQTTTDPETGLPSGNKIVFKELPSENAPNPDDVLAYFDKLVYDKLSAELEKGSKPNPFGIPGMFDEEPEAASDRDLVEERRKKIKSKRLMRRRERLRKKIARVVHRAYKRCIVECTKESMPDLEVLTVNTVKAALTTAGLSCSKTCEEESRELVTGVQDSAKSLFKTFNKKTSMEINKKRKLQRRALESLANPTVGGGNWKYDDVGVGATARLAVLRRLHGNDN